MLILTRALALTALLTVFTACADAPRQPASTPQADTADDADAEPPVQPSAAPQQAAPESKIGLMALLNPLPADARCTVDASGLEARYTLQGDEIPTRVVRSASGDSARS